MCLIRVNPNERPNAEEILNYTPISLRIKEKKLKEYYIKIKKKENDIKKREENLIIKEKEIDDKINDIKERENELNIKEEKLEEKELELHKREMMVEIKEKELYDRENNFKNKFFENNNNINTKTQIGLNNYEKNDFF